MRRTIISCEYYRISMELAGLTVHIVEPYKVYVSTFLHSPSSFCSYFGGTRLRVKTLDVGRNSDGPGASATGSCSTNSAVAALYLGQRKGNGAGLPSTVGTVAATDASRESRDADGDGDRDNGRGERLERRRKGRLDGPAPATIMRAL